MKSRMPCYVNRGRWNREFRGRRGRYSIKSFRGAAVRNERKLNPLNSAGNPTKFAVCQSIFHWAKDCPDSYENSKEEINVTCLQMKSMIATLKLLLGRLWA